jgi:hypothetical protein
MVNNQQIRTMTYDPRTILAFAQMIHNNAVKNGIPKAQVFAKIKFSLNGRPAQYFVNPDVDMVTASYSPFKKLDWVMPLEHE